MIYQIDQTHPGEWEITTTSSRRVTTVVAGPFTSYEAAYAAYLILAAGE